jgi:hypothetical protein
LSLSPRAGRPGTPPARRRSAPLERAAHARTSGTPRGGGLGPGATRRV